MKRTFAAIAGIALATACSSGGAGTNGVPTTGSAASVAARVPITASLTIQFPTGFGRATATSAANGKQAQYVNPTAGNYIDVYLNQTLVLISGSGLNFDTAAVTNTNGDGTQTISLPLYSLTPYDIVVAERTTNANPSISAGNLLALGQSIVPPVAAGSANLLAVSMAMNLTGFAYSFNNSTATTIVPYQTITTPGSQSGPTGNGFWILPTDFSNGYTTTASGSGLPLPVVSYTPIAAASPPPSNIVQNSFGEYFASYDSNHDAISNATISATNPAFAVYKAMSAADQNALNGGYFYNSGAIQPSVSLFVNFCC